MNLQSSGSPSRRLPAFFLYIGLLAACSPATQGGSGMEPGRVVQPSQTLVIVTRGEPDSFADKALRRTGGRTQAASLRVFNAGLVFKDERETPNPYLAEALPQLNTDRWRVLPDGRMETTYRLKPGLTWQDGVPLSAEDFVFSWRVYSVPDFGHSSSPPLTKMEDVVAVDPATVVIRWNGPFAEADALTASDLPALPRHILERSFQEIDSEAFIAHPYWAGELVGLGPYRMERREPGAFVEGLAFDGHALGRPKIDRVRVVFFGDPNTVVANLLAGAASIAVDDSLRFEQGVILQRQWSGGGTVLFSPTQVRWTQVQLKPEVASPRALMDLRVRRALAHAIDKEPLIEGLLEGQGTPADTLLTPQVEYFADLERAVAKYAYDPRRTEQLLNEAGFTRGGDGFYSSPSDGRFALDLRAAQGTQNESEITIMADGYRRVGIDSSIFVIPQAVSNDAEFRASFPGLSATSNVNGFEPPVGWLRALEIPRPENRWRGSNRGGWSNPAFERVVDAYDTSLARGERNQQVVQMMRIVSEELPGFALYYNFGVVAHAAGLQGPRLGSSNFSWNLHEWTWS